jgi:hypothetical protein
LRYLGLQEVVILVNGITNIHDDTNYVLNSLKPETLDKSRKRTFDPNFGSQYKEHAKSESNLI